MEKEKRVIVAGEGHLSFQVYRKLKEKGYAPVRVVCESKEKMRTVNGEYSVYEQYKECFELAGIAEADVVYLVDDQDQYNIQFFLIASSLNPRARLVISLFDDSLAPHLRSGHKLLEVYNPAAIAAAEFANAALKKPTKKIPARTLEVPLAQERGATTLVRSLYAMVAVFFLIFIAAVGIFHYYNHMSWVDSVYYTGTVITTTGFNDLLLVNASPIIKLFGVALMFAGVSLISIVFSFIVEWLLSRRAELALGRKQYKLRGHIILCGLGRLGYQVSLDLLQRGYDVLIIESNPDNRFIDLVRASGGQVFIADASLSRNLRRANVSHARTLLSVTQNDLKNLEVGLIARSLQPTMPLVLRIFDKDIAAEMQRRLTIPALSASAITAKFLLKKI